MIRILHTADWHLGQTFFGYDRTGEHEVFLNWLAEEIRQKEIDALIIAGDVFDVSNPSAASQSMYYQFIYRVTVENPNLQIVIVAGNHDSACIPFCIIFLNFYSFDAFSFESLFCSRTIHIKFIFRSCIFGICMASKARCAPKTPDSTLHIAALPGG